MAQRLSLWGGLALLCVSGADAFLSRALPVTTQAQPRVICTRPLEAVPFTKDTFDMLVSGAGLLLSLSPAVQQGYRALSPNSTAIAVDSLNASTIVLNEALEGDLLVKRECFAKFRDMVEFARHDKQNPCVLVYGPRGCGKTSLVQAAMQDMAGVLSMPYSGDGKDFEERLERALLRLGGLEIAGQSVETGDLLRTILACYKLVHNCRPIFVVEINQKMEPAALSDLLLAIKQLGFEEKLATFIVVLSASRSALGLTISIQDLRVEGYQAGDFNAQEAREYISTRLEADDELAEFVLEQIGTRVMDLVNVCKECRRAASSEEYQDRVRAFRARRIEDARFALRGFLGISRRNGAAFDKKAGIAFFQRLLKGTPQVTDWDAEMAFGFVEPAALLLALGTYHAFAIDPFDHKVSMQSHFMHIVLTEYLASEAEKNGHGRV